MKITDTIKKSLVTLSVVAGVFLFVLPASASIYSQTDNSTLRLSSLDTSVANTFGQELGNNISGEITSVTIYASSTGSQLLTIEIWECTNSTFLSGGSATCNNSVDYQSDYKNLTGLNYYTFNFSTHIPVTNGKYYYLIYSWSDSNTYLIDFYGSSANVYSGGAFCKGSNCSLSIADSYFLFQGSLVVEQSISITIPRGGFFGADFSYWNLQGIDTLNATSTHLYRIYYGLSGGSYSYQDALSRTHYAELMSIAVPKLTSLSNGNYKAYATLEDQTNTIVATSSVILFTINNNASNTAVEDFLDRFSSSTPTRENTCDNSYSEGSFLSWMGIQRALCNVMYYFGTIAEGTIAKRVTGIPDYMLHRFPFSLYLDTLLFFSELSASYNGASTTITAYIDTREYVGSSQTGTRTPITFANLQTLRSNVLIDSIWYFEYVMLHLVWGASMLYLTIKVGQKIL